MSKIEELLERVRAATGSDGGLNAEIHEAAGLAFEMEYWSESDTTPVRNLSKVPRYTASIDATLALTERVLPGWSYHVSKHEYDGEHPPLFVARVATSSANVVTGFDEVSDHSAVLAIIAATLSALISRGTP